MPNEIDTNHVFILILFLLLLLLSGRSIFSWGSFGDRSGNSKGLGVGKILLDLKEINSKRKAIRIGEYPSVEVNVGMCP
jgi:hypothetical protein